MDNSPSSKDQQALLDIQRKAFEAGAQWSYSHYEKLERDKGYMSFVARIREAARNVFPDPPQYREVTLSNGIRYRIENGTLMSWCKSWDGTQKWFVTRIDVNTLNPNDLRLIADLRENPNG